MSNAPHAYDGSYSTADGESGRCVICHQTPSHPWHSDSAIVKHKVREGHVPVLEALEDPAAATVEIGVLIAAQPEWTRERAHRLLDDLEIFEARHVRELRMYEAVRIKQHFEALAARKAA